MKYCIKFNDDTLPIQENEIEKVIKAMSTKSIVILSCGVLHGSFIRGIVRDIHTEKQLYYYEKLTADEHLEAKDYQFTLPKLKLNK